MGTLQQGVPQPCPPSVLLAVPIVACPVSLWARCWHWSRCEGALDACPWHRDGSSCLDLHIAVCVGYLVCIGCHFVDLAPLRRLSLRILIDRCKDPVTGLGPVVRRVPRGLMEADWEAALGDYMARSEGAGAGEDE